MRHLAKALVIITLMSCSTEEEVFMDTNLSNSIEYFSHVEDLTYPSELESYAELNNLPPWATFNSGNHPAYIIISINYLKEDMGSLMEDLKPKDWWQPLDSIPINDYGPSAIINLAYIVDRFYYSNTYMWTDYFQFTQTDENQYFLTGIEYGNPEENINEIVGVESAWQNINKTVGGIDRYYDPINWRYTSDSLIIDQQSFGPLRQKLNLSLADYSGTLIREENDSTYIYKWNGNGNGSFLVKHSETGLSLNPEEYW